MREFARHGSTHILADTDNLLVDDGEVIYLYHLVCGGLKMAHSYRQTDTAILYEDHQMIRSVIAPCCCYRMQEKDTIQHLLHNIYVSLGACKTIEDARLMIKEFASREEMREPEHQRL